MSDYVHLHGDIYLNIFISYYVDDCRNSHIMPEQFKMGSRALASLQKRFRCTRFELYSAPVIEVGNTKRSIAMHTVYINYFHKNYSHEIFQRTFGKLSNSLWKH